MSDNTRETNAFTEENNRVDTEFIKCEGCGANMVFDPDKQVLSCPHCGSQKQFNLHTYADEIDLSEGFSEDRWEGNVDQYECDNCGAKVVLSAGETANKCPFCGTAHVQKSQTLTGLKPNALLPFTFGKDRALELSKAWAKGKFFAPKKFKKKLQAENVNGVYVPCFTFDSWTTSEFVGRIGRTYTRTVGSGKNRRVETYTVWKNISGVHYDNFDDLLFSAGSKCDQKQINKLAPFDTNNSKIYDENYLLGFMAYRYDYEVSSCWDMAKGVIDSSIRSNILSGYVYDKVAYLNVSTRHDKVTYKYVMLPVYVGNFNYAKKPYNFYINGNTGKVWGKTPKSFWKILLTVAIPIGVVVGGWFILRALGVI